MIKESFIYNGEVIHKRFKPKVHYFRYKVFSLFIDLKELSKLKYSVPNFIQSDTELSSLNLSIREADVKDGGEGAILIKLRNL